MAIKRLDDIEREKAKENREKIKKELTEDVSDVIDNVFKGQKKKRPVMNFIFAVLKILGLVILVVIILDLLLGSFWLLKFFTKSLFNIG